MKKIKVGVIGAGLIGEVHAKTYSEYEKSELSIICDIKEERARRLAEKYNCKYTTDINLLAKDPEIRAVSIVTPDFAHYKPVMEMIESGKDILCEKPLAMKVSEAKQMVEKAKEKGVRLMVDFQNRWSPLFLQVKKEIENDNFGDLVVGYARLSNTLFVPLNMVSWADKTGPQWFLYPHLIDLVRWLLNEEVEEVYALGHKGILKEKGLDIYDAIQSIVKFKSGFVTFETSWVLPESWPSLIDFKMDLLGTKSRIGITGDHQGISVAGKKFSYPFILSEQNAFGKTVGFFHEPIIHFVDSIFYNRKVESPGKDGLAITKIITAIEKSISEKKAVKLKM